MAMIYAVRSERSAPATMGSATAAQGLANPSSSRRRPFTSGRSGSSGLMSTLPALDTRGRCKSSPSTGGYPLQQRVDELSGRPKTASSLATASPAVVSPTASWKSMEYRYRHNGRRRPRSRNQPHRLSITSQPSQGFSAAAPESMVPQLTAAMTDIPTTSTTKAAATTSTHRITPPVAPVNAGLHPNTLSPHNPLTLANGDLHPSNAIQKLY